MAKQMNLIDKSFKPENADRYELSIQVDKDLFNYCIFDPERKQYVGFRSYRGKDMGLPEDLMSQLEGIFLQDDLLDLPYRKTRLVYYTKLSTLVPDHFFEDRFAREYLGFNHTFEPGDEVFCNFIPACSAWNVFSIPAPVVSILSNQFRSGYFMHQATPFLLPGAGRNRLKEDHYVKIGINRDFFDVAVFRESHLQLYNTYPYVNETDLLYYVLYVLKEMRLEPQTAILFLSGEMSTRLLYYDTLKQYIPGLAYADAADTFTLAPSLYSISVHKFLNILTLHNCVSSVENTREEGYL